MRSKTSTSQPRYRIPNEPTLLTQECYRKEWQKKTKSIQCRFDLVLSSLDVSFSVILSLTVHKTLPLGSIAYQRAEHIAPEGHDEQHSFASFTCFTARPIIHDPTLTSSCAYVRRTDLFIEMN